MKNKFTIISRLAVAGVALSLCVAGLAAAETQNPDAQPAAKAAAPKGAAPKAEAKKTDSAAKTTATALSAKDKTFMQNAAKGGMAEVEMGKMAQAKGQSDGVKKFGARMVAEHGNANNELMALAAKKGVKLSAAKSKMAKMGANFDKEYMAEMIKDHQKDLAEFQGAAKDATDPDVKKFAEKGSKMVQKHLKLAQETQSKLK
ncbi:MAG: putative rane protein [Verrucomicrobiota bacterium]|jgi:putative membrane protein